MKNNSFLISITGMAIFMLALLFTATNAFATAPSGYGYGYGYGYSTKGDVVDPVISFIYESKHVDAPFTMSIVITDDSAISKEDISISNQTSSTVTNFVCEQISSRKVTCTFLVSSSGRVHVHAFDEVGNRENEILRHIEITQTEQGEVIEETIQEEEVIQEDIIEREEDITYELYRFWSPSRKGHFYTTSREERDMVVADAQLDYRYEGIAYHVSPVQTEVNPQAIYRFWSDVYNKHFYTASEGEKNSVIANNPQWAYEGIAFYGSTSFDNPTGEMVYRFWSDTFKGHFYTASQSEVNELRIYNDDWTYEGVSWQINTSVSDQNEVLSVTERCVASEGVYNTTHDICFVI